MEMVTGAKSYFRVASRVLVEGTLETLAKAEKSHAGRFQSLLDGAS